MDIQFYGANTFKISTKEVALVVDDNPEEHKGKSYIKKGDIALYTKAHATQPEEAKLIIGQPGEYEVAGFSVLGVPARAHIDTEDSESATVYKIISKDIRILVVGHIYPELNDDQLEQIGVIDIILVPVGGNGYTLDGIGALKIIKKVEPKIIIPCHYESKDVNYQVPQQSLDQALEQLGMEVAESTDKLKIKSSTDISEISRLIVVNPS